MFELAGTSTKLGIFELRLEKRAPFFLDPILKIGPFKGRAIGLIGLAIALLLSLSLSPARFFLEQNWASSEEAARELQYSIGNAVLFISCAFYALVFLFRKEKLDLVFDRPSGEFAFFHIPIFRFAPVKEGLSRFQDIEKIEVFAKDKTPQTPYGYIQITNKRLSKGYQKISFQLLSEEQFEIYPKNLSQITGKEAVGDLKSE